MLGQPVSMLIPQVVGFKLAGAAARGRDRDRPRADRHADAAQEGRRRQVRRVLRPRPRPACRSPTAPRSPTWRPSTAPPAASSRSTPRRSTTCASPAGRDAQVAAGRGVHARSRASSTPRSRPSRVYTDTLELDLGTVEPSLAGPTPAAGPRRASRDVKSSFRAGARRRCSPGSGQAAPRASRLAARPAAPRRPRRGAPSRRRGRAGRRRRAARTASVVIAAITSCTNTSNPSVMIAAGLLAQEGGRERASRRKPWVKTSLAPGSKVVTDYLRRGRPDAVPRAARLQPRRLRLHDLHRQQRPAAGRDLARRSTRATWSSAAVLSGNRNFEGRIHPEVRANYLASPPLVVAYALAGRIDIDLDDRAARHRHATASRSILQGHLADARRRSRRPIARGLHVARCSSSEYARRLRRATSSWHALRRARGRPLRLGRRRRPTSSSPPYFDGHAGRAARRSTDIRGARVLGVLGDSITTDHISPAGSIKADEPGRQVPASSTASPPQDFNSVRRPPRQPRGDDARHLRQRPPHATSSPPATEGGVTRHLPDGEPMSIFDAAMQYQAERRAARRPRRQGVRHRLVARLGGQGPAAPGRPRRHRRELRAHPPQQPGRHGHPAARVHRRARPPPASASPARRSIDIDGLADGDRQRLRRRPRGHRPGDASDGTARRRSRPASASTRRRRCSTTARRHPAVRAAPAAEGGEVGDRRSVEPAVRRSPASALSLLPAATSRRTLRARPRGRRCAPGGGR